MRIAGRCWRRAVGALQSSLVSSPVMGPFMLARRGCASRAAGERPADARAAVAAAANALYAGAKHHRALSASGDTVACRAVEWEMWCVLQSVTDDAVEAAATRDACELLVAWNYFGRYWERGMEGPSARARAAAAAAAAAAGEGEGDGGDGGEAARSAAVAIDIPPATREADELRRDQHARQDVMAPPRRANPLDEVLEF